MKKIIVGLLSMIVVILSYGIVLVQANTIIDSGKCGYNGANVTWTLDDEGELTIGGTGEMDNPPYLSKYADNITDAVIEEGVTCIGIYAFSGCHNLRSVNISETVQYIDYAAFADCTSLTSLTLPNSVTTLYNDICPNCPNLKDIYYLGTKEQWSQVQQINSTLPDTIKIHCTQSDYTYRFLDYDGTVLKISTALYGSIIEPPTSPTRQSDVSTYTFASWNGYTEGITLTEDVDFVAQYDSEPITNRAAIIGDRYMTVGDTGITETVSVTLDNQIRSAIFEIQYPSYLTLTTVTAKDFSFAQQSGEPQTTDNITTARILCQYSSSESSPVNTLLNPFDLVFDVATTAEPATGEISISRITLNTAEGETATITDFDGQQIEISPRLVDSIQINGDDKAYEKAQYTAVISPEYATNKGIVWSVDDDTVAEISQNGLLTAKKNGTVIITATSADGNTYATKQVEVHAYATINNIISDIGGWDKTFQPNIRQYTVTVPSSASQVSFTATANMGAVYGNDNLMLSGLSQSFNLVGDSTEIEFAIKGVSDFDDGIYTVRVLREVQSELIPLDEYKNKISIQKTETTDTITLTIEPIADMDLSNMCLYVAEYDGGVLSSVWCGKNSVVGGKLVVTADKPTEVDYKIMIWDKMCPVVGVIGE